MTEEAQPAAEVQGDTLQSELRAARQRAVNRENRDFAIPGYGGRLWGTFRALDDYSQVREFVERHRNISDDATRELYVAAETMVVSCTEVYALRDGQRVMRGRTMGRDLAAYLGEVVENDRQGVFAIFPSTLALMDLFGEIQRWFRDAGERAAKDTAGNSPAAGS